VVAILATVVTLPVHTAEPETSGPLTLAGVWTLDVEKSDSAQEKMEALRRAGGRGPGGGMGGGMRGGGRRGGGMPGGIGRGRPPRGPGEGPGEGEPRERPRDPEQRLMMRPPASILIEQTDSTVVLFEQGLPIEVLVIGLPQDKAGAIEPGAIHIPASWSAGRLLALREDDRGGRATQQFALSADGRSLTLTLRREPREDGVPPLEIRREYRRDDGE
jgi:hypothetical protein